MTDRKTLQLQQDLEEILKDVINDANESIKTSQGIYIPNKNVDKMNDKSREIIKKISHSLLIIGKLSQKN